MREFAVFFLSIFAVFIVVDKIYKRNQEISQVKSLIDDRTYIVRKLPDSQRAADKLAEINRKIINLIDSLKKEDREGIETLKDRYNPDQLSETGLGAKYTSYSVNKGEKISICVRHEDNKFIDDNIIVFVVIHELSGRIPGCWPHVRHRDLTDKLLDSVGERMVTVVKTTTDVRTHSPCHLVS